MNVYCHFRLIGNLRICVFSFPLKPTRRHFKSTFVPKNCFAGSQARYIHMLQNDDHINITAEEIRKAVCSALFHNNPQEGHVCYSIDCPSCKEHSKNPGRLKINLTTGYTFCTSCFLHGPWSSMDSYLKNLKKYRANPKKMPGNITKFLHSVWMFSLTCSANLAICRSTQSSWISRVGLGHATRSSREKNGNDLECCWACL